MINNSGSKNEINYPAELSLGNFIYLPYPDGFHILTDEEKNNLNLLSDGLWSGISDPERHILITAGYKRTGKLISLIIDDKSLAVNAEKQVSKSMSQFGYILSGTKECKIINKNARGFAYEYTSSSIKMYGETYALKIGNNIY